MSKTRLQVAKMCNYIEDVFSNDAIVCTYYIWEDVATILVDYPLYPYALWFSFIVLKKPWGSFYYNITIRLKEDVEDIIRKGALRYGYLPKN